MKRRQVTQNKKNRNVDKCLRVWPPNGNANKHHWQITDATNVIGTCGICLLHFCAGRRKRFAKDAMHVQLITIRIRGIMVIRVGAQREGMWKYEILRT